MKRKICIVTGSRAEYGLLRTLMRLVRNDPRLSLQIIATGMHLSPEFGLTVRDMERDGFTPDVAVEMLLSSDTPIGVLKSMGLGLISFSEAFDRLKPDIVVVLGDRFEIFAAAQAAYVSRIPIAHLHGGETTEGAIDEAFRHAITKMAHLHFVAAAPYRDRVIQMGEDPQKVFLVGAPGLDMMSEIDFLSRVELEKELGITLSPPVLLVTYHPVTLEKDSTRRFRTLIEALDSFPEASILFTLPNADTDGRVIIEDIERFVKERPSKRRAFASLGAQRYLSLMKQADAVVGNSSSGFTEAPALGIPVVNIGDRQKGRLRAASVIDCPEETNAITESVRKAISQRFRDNARDTDSPYGSGGASRAILETLASFPLSGIVIKRFFDIPFSTDGR